MKKLVLIALMALKRKVMITSQQNIKSYMNITKGVIKSSVAKQFKFLYIAIYSIPWLQNAKQVHGRQNHMLMLFVTILFMRPG